MKEVFLIYFFTCLCSIVVGSDFDESKAEDESTDEENGIDRNDDNGETDLDSTVGTSNCWMTLNVPEHFKIMDDIDARYKDVREQVQESLKNNFFDESMTKRLIQKRGVAMRESYAKNHEIHMIPSGLNLGGYCMLRMPDSLLFFHRLKVRNNTHFHVNFLYNDLANMMVTMKLELHDLHLKGAYERSLTEQDASVLIYAPTFGQVEFLLKNVKYKIDGRYRLIKNKLLIELVNSEIIVDDTLMTYVNQAISSSPIKIHKDGMGYFISRLKRDLNKWIKDYFNDYLIDAAMDGIPNLEELAKYDKEKGTALEEFTDNTIQAIRTRLRLLDAASIKVPSFTFKATTGMQLKLHQGVINGLDSIYRRSVATGYNNDGIRKVDSIVAFSNMKVVYKYEAWIPTGIPPLAGVITLSSNDLTAHLALRLIADPETIDMDIELLDQMRPESLTVEGAANIMISNFKHLLEHQMVATMSNTLIHGIMVLNSLPRCELPQDEIVVLNISELLTTIISELPQRRIYVKRYKTIARTLFSLTNSLKTTTYEPFIPGRIIHKKEPEKKQFSNWDSGDVWENEEILRGKPDLQRRSMQYTTPIMKQSNIHAMKMIKNIKAKARKFSGRRDVWT